MVTPDAPRSPPHAVPRALGVLLVLAAGSAEASATSVTATTDAPITSQDLQVVYEGCLRQLDDGETTQAAGCLERVYGGLVVIDPIARTDLYYVLADLVGAHRAAASTEPRWLCRARDLVNDYVTRERRAPVVRFRGKVRAMTRGLDKAIREADAQTGRDICLDLPGTTVGGPSIDATPTPGAATAPPITDSATPLVPGPDPSEPAAAITAPTPTVDPAAKPAIAAKRSPVRRLELTAQTDLMDAGFATTLISVGVAGLGGALWAASIECKARHLTESRCDPDPLPEGIRDAGLALMSVGAAGVVVGLALRWVDQRRQRKLRKTPLPLVGTTTVGLEWRMRF
jgi:hypothetical protein